MAKDTFYDRANASDPNDDKALFTISTSSIRCSNNRALDPSST
jgi:hypothetical protein